MGLLTITEYANIAVGQGGRLAQVPEEPPLAEQFLTFTTHVESVAFNAQTRFVRLNTDTACFVKFGAAPVAVTGQCGRMAANQTDVRGVPLGGSLKVSVVA